MTDFPSHIDVHTLALRILSIYEKNSDYEPLINELYAPNARLSDPFVDVNGFHNVHAQLRGFREIISSTRYELVNAAVTGCTLIIEAIANIHYRPIPFLLSGQHMKLIITAKFHHGKIFEQTNHWDIASILKNVPVMGHFYNIFRFILGLSTSRIFDSIDCVSNMITGSTCKAAKIVEEAPEKSMQYAEKGINLAAQGLEKTSHMAAQARDKATEFMHEQGQEHADQAKGVVRGVTQKTKDVTSSMTPSDEGATAEGAHIGKHEPGGKGVPAQEAEKQTTSKSRK